MRRTIAVLSAVVVVASLSALGLWLKGPAPVAAAAGGAAGTGRAEAAPGDQWEYLVVTGPSNTNFSPSGSSSLRKDRSGAFAREGFVLEQQMDKLGSKGWALVSVSGPPNEPIYYFKRPKQGDSDR